MRTVTIIVLPICFIFITTAHLSMTFDEYNFTQDIDKGKESDINFNYKFNFSTTFRCGKAARYDNFMTFRGTIFDFNVWARPLTLNQMLRFTKDCEEVSEGNKKVVLGVIDCNAVEYFKMGSVAKVMTSISVSCDRSTETLTLQLTTNADTFKEAFHWVVNQGTRTS